MSQRHERAVAVLQVLFREVFSLILELFSELPNFSLNEDVPKATNDRFFCANHDHLKVKLKQER